MGSLVFDLPGFLNILISALIGVVTGIVITHWYARRSERQLHIIARAFARLAQEQGLVTWTENATGEITFGRVITQDFTVSYDVEAAPTDNLQSGSASLHGAGSKSTE
jgi:hypothetical protein